MGRVYMYTEKKTLFFNAFHLFQDPEMLSKVQSFLMELVQICLI